MKLLCRKFYRRQILGVPTDLDLVVVVVIYHYSLEKVAQAEAWNDYELVAALLDVELVPGYTTQG